MDELRRAAAVEGAELRALAHVAADFIRLSDEVFLTVDPADASVAEQHFGKLEIAADRLAAQYNAYRVARDVARRLRDGQS
jgi:hypothetical protein